MRRIGETVGSKHELDVARANVGPLLHKMHALGWPDRHRAELYIDVDGLWEGVIESPGAIMLDPDVPISMKASAIRYNFLPIAHRIDRLSHFKADRSLKLRHFLIRHTVDEDRDLWRDQTGRQLTVGELLPPAEIVEAMFVNWDDHGAPRCPNLEAYIGESLMRGVAIGLSADAN